MSNYHAETTTKGSPKRGGSCSLRLVYNTKVSAMEFRVTQNTLRLLLVCVQYSSPLKGYRLLGSPSRPCFELCHLSFLIFHSTSVLRRILMSDPHPIPGLAWPCSIPSSWHQHSVPSWRKGRRRGCLNSLILLSTELRSVWLLQSTCFRQKPLMHKASSGSCPLPTSRVRL